MKIDKFEDIIAWKKSREFTIEIYKQFEKNRDFGFRDQIQRASVSVMNNIAEGFERRGDKEFRHFLFISDVERAKCKNERSEIFTFPSRGSYQRSNTSELCSEVPLLLRDLLARCAPCFI